MPDKTIYPCNWHGCPLAFPRQSWLVEHITDHMEREKLGFMPRQKTQMLAKAHELAEKWGPLTVTVRPKQLRKIGRPFKPVEAKLVGSGFLVDHG